MKSIRLRRAPLPLLGVVLVAGVASGQPSSAQKAMAIQLFEDAGKLMASGKSADACPKHAESQRLDPQLGTLLHLARCYEKIGKTASAWATFKDAVEDAAQKKDDREAAARARVADLARKLPKLVVAVPKTAPPGIELWQDREVVGPAAWGSPVPVDPGKHSIIAKAPGYRLWSTTIDVPATGDTVRVNVPLLERESEGAATPETDQSPVANPASAGPGVPGSESASAATASGSGHTQRLVGWTLVGVGGAGLVVGLAGAAKAGSKKSSLDQAGCADGHCFTDQRNDVDAYNSARTLSTLGFIVGGVGLAAGAALLLTVPPAEHAARPGVSPWIGVGSVGLAGRF